MNDAQMLAEHVLKGLSATRKALSWPWFHNDKGTRRCQHIIALPKLSRRIDTPSPQVTFEPLPGDYCERRPVVARLRRSVAVRLGNNPGNIDRSGALGAAAPGRTIF